MCDYVLNLTMPMLYSNYLNKVIMYILDNVLNYNISHLHIHSIIILKTTYNMLDFEVIFKSIASSYKGIIDSVRKVI